MVRCVADLDALSERLAPRILTAGRNGNESLLSNGQSQTVSAPLKNMLRHIPALDGHVPARLPIRPASLGSLLRKRRRTMHVLVFKSGSVLRGTCRAYAEPSDGVLQRTWIRSPTDWFLASPRLFATNWRRRELLVITRARVPKRHASCVRL